LVRRIVIYAALVVVGEALLVAGPAIAKSKTTSCSSVTVGHYKATNVRATPNLGCKAAVADLRVWLKHPNKLPHNAKSWHAKLVRGTWQMAYGRYPVSLYFVLVKVTATPTTTPTSGTNPNPNPTSTTPTSQPPSGATPPTITIASPGNGASFTWGQAAKAQFSCSDNVPVTSCTATVGTVNVANGASLPTSGAPGPGTRTLTVTATDSSGNKSTQSVSYVVQPAGYYAIELHDGPNAQFTQPALDALASVNAKANFFLIGENVTANPALAQEEVARGMLIGNHTQTHADVGPSTSPYFVAPGPIAPDTASLEIQNGATSIINATGVTPTLFMPPYGDYGTDSTVQNLVTSLTGETLCAWTVDSTDSDSPLPSTAAIVASAETVQAGGMIEMHDSSQNTANAIPTIVTDLRNNKGLQPGKMYANPAVSVPGPFGDPQPAFHCAVEPF
jgi:peptidoglycan/xylan/chitin deacetylase (PgdA/CDA1 family)